MNEDYITKRFGYFIPKKDKDLRKILEDSNWNFQLQLIRDLQQENKQLKIQVGSREEVANKYKEVIDKATKYINDEIKREAFHHYLDDEDIQELLDILKESGE